MRCYEFRIHRFAACIVACAVLAGCSSTWGGENAISDGLGWISFAVPADQPAHQGYSAFDGNHHAYQLVVTIPSASDTPSSTNPNPVVPSSLVWTIDHVVLAAEAYPDIPGAILLTTKRAGVTSVEVAGTKLWGDHMQSTAKLTISQATPEEWAQGDKLFNTMLESSAPASDAGMSDCTLPSDDDAIPKSSTCSNCHQDTPAITPAQTAGYTDDDLLDIFETGHKPAGYYFSSDLLKTAPMPECLFQQFHRFDIDSDAAKRGLVWKLRSLPPRAH